MCAWWKITYHSCARAAFAWRPPQTGGRAPPVPLLLLTSSRALSAHTRMWSGNRESHGPLTPPRRSAALGHSRRPSRLSWRFPVQTRNGLPSGRNASGCCHRASVCLSREPAEGPLSPEVGGIPVSASVEWRHEPLTCVSVTDRPQQVTDLGDQISTASALYWASVSLFYKTRDFF